MSCFRYCRNPYTPQYFKLYSTKAKSQPKQSNGKFKNTIILPQTSFEPFPKNVAERDGAILKKAKFLEYYDWQREHVKGKEFVLHDGPPYANGTPHMGHAINKIYKDIILRSKLIQGQKVHYVPGWDCHGLPIELLALKETKEKLKPMEIREKSQNLAFEKLELQKNTFQKWGVLGSWDKYYYTCSPEYVINEIELFWKLYEKGYIYYDHKPVYWSPSSGTALAESELEYNDAHVSPAVTVRFEVVDTAESEPVYLLLWTTTPWTLPFNRAVYFSKTLDYSLVKIDSLPGYYIIASVLIENCAKKLQKQISDVRTVPHEELLNMKYRHPWRKDEILRVFESSTVKELATGLLHCSPANGHQDFLLGLKDGLPMECHVNEEGRYTKEMGSDLCGLYVINEGSEYVTEKLREDILLKESFVHSYPYDWRTKKPVIIRSSKQWFIRTDGLKEAALESVSEVSGLTDHFKQNLQKRPYWCLSRQRVWGVPIPAFFNKNTGEPLVSKEIVDHVCRTIKEHGTHSWWTLDKEQLFPQSICDKLNVKIQDVEKGRDIMDIWFDSGISWSFALDGKVADLYVEGVDQFRGWFQSSLLTSVAVRGMAPYKKIIVHGMAVDENQKKMSKSLGNVFDPNKALEGKQAVGVDTLRWWVASHGHLSLAPVSMDILEDRKDEVKRIRLILKFILGALNGCNEDLLINTSPSYCLDRYVLDKTKHTYDDVMTKYNDYFFQGVVSKLLSYVANTLSADYFSLIKDRLYCDDVYSIRRKSCILALSGVLDALCHCIAPIMPHLVEEVYLNHPVYSGKHFFYNEKMWTPPTTWKDESASKYIDLATNLRQEVFTQCNNNAKQFSCYIQVEDDYGLLKELNGGEEYSADSELTELLQVADVTVSVGSRNVELKKTDKSMCQRCRRYTAVNAELCSRCADVIGKLVSGNFLSGKVK